MNQVAVKYRYEYSADNCAQRPARPQLAVINGGLASSTQREIFLLGAILATLQILDGILTAIGMASFGTGMEGNVLLRTLMQTIGYLPALILVKGFSLGMVTMLCWQAHNVYWIKTALRGVIAIYIAFAVAPWSYILTLEFLL
ncbi:MAG: DUF5658 family protein [Proteobacteria bacterium]|nr:DUF5658 family protein [Pseudomonadota bacterium]